MVNRITARPPWFRKDSVEASRTVPGRPARMTARASSSSVPGGSVVVVVVLVLVLVVVVLRLVVVEMLDEVDVVRPVVLVDAGSAPEASVAPLAHADATKAMETKRPMRMP